LEKGVADDDELAAAAEGEAVCCAAFAKEVNPAVPNKLFSTVNPLDANAAAKAFYEFKDVVKAAQR